MNCTMVIIMAGALLQANLYGWQERPTNPNHPVAEQTSLRAASPEAKTDSQAAGRSNVDPAITKLTVGPGPQGIAFTPGAVWVAWGDDRDFGVSRIDPNTLETAATIRTGKWPVGVAVGEGAVWVVNRDDNSVSRIDPETNQVVATIEVGKSPLCVIVGEGSVWVTNGSKYSRTISRIDPGSNTVTATITVGLGPSGIAVSNGSIWVANYWQGTIARVDPATNKVKKTILLREPCRLTLIVRCPGPAQPNQIVAAGDTLWVTADDKVLRINAETNKIEAWVPVPPAKPLVKPLLGGLIRVPNLKNDVDRLHSTPGRPTGVAVAGDVLWVADWLHDSLWKIDIPTGKTFGLPLAVGKNPLILGPGNDGRGAIWVSNSGDGTIMRVRP